MACNTGHAFVAVSTSEDIVHMDACVTRSLTGASAGNAQITFFFLAGRAEVDGKAALGVTLQLAWTTVT